jgi:mono/diheme cytochrome c family protein
MRIPIALLSLTVLVLALAGCRGWRSERQPIHPNLNMDFTENFKAQRPNPFFEDNMAMRTPPPGTVARARLQTAENAPYLLGRDAGGQFVETMPVDITAALLARGQERYNIFCTVCHGAVGDGQGIIMVGNQGQGYGYVPAPTFHSDASRALSDGYLYDALTNGIRNMPGYGHQIPVADRWAIVAHIRALQRSQHAAAQDLPSPEAQRLRATPPTPDTE